MGAGYSEFDEANGGRKEIIVRDEERQSQAEKAKTAGHNQR